MPGIGSMVVIGAAALLIFGPKKLPELGRAAGDTLREFKNSTKGLAEDDEERTEDNKESK
ncbi:twin-arginine translocase TatA/TatE family subunit [Domibacillus robiginosus]|uniref:twin-arginine translocase TatA/TatE family subunit n=1 Tax=Domibacillus robiginosus TaxID=1071054 RepID=UPI00067BDFD2|nr:twin-arginine translocase TatA/TatE family subunit [Domibacillus robiginosus]